MYNLNMSGPGGSGLLSLPLPQGENSTTPRTPEIVNSLMAMSNPFESSYRAHAPRLASSPPGGSDTSTSSSAGSGGCMSPPSVQHTCSQLIKEGLKLTIQSKRRQNQRGAGAQAGEEPKIPRRDEVSGSGDPLGLGDDDDDDPFSPGDGLTPEDEERRRRRRERNKIAATKCRLKKRERTVNLVHESEILETQNNDLKSQIQELESQRRKLVDMLSVHQPTCTKSQHTHAFSPTEPANFQTFTRPPSRISMEANTNMFRRMNMNTFPRTNASVVDTMSYRRVEMSSTCVEPYQRMEAVLEESSYCRPPMDSTVYHNFDAQEVKDTLVPYCRSSVGSDESPPPFSRIALETLPSFTRIGEQYSCQNLTNMDHFVKPELPSMAGFHSPASSFGRHSSLDITNSVSPSFDSVNSPNLTSATYQQFEDESDTFSSGFSPTGIDRNCIT